MELEPDVVLCRRRVEAELREGAADKESTEELLRERSALDKVRGFLLSTRSELSGVGVGAASRETEDALRLHRSTLIV
jgi:hypothetical protein